MATRDYKREYRNYRGNPTQIANRASRNAARAKMVKAGAAHKGDGKDVDHKDSNPRHNARSNLRMSSKAANRSRR